ncbi:MAG TPA: tetratricopeptide repeat protein [Lacunisphaera sp.]
MNKPKPTRPSSGADGRRGKRWVTGALVLLFAALAGGAAWWWRQPNLAERVQAAIPKQPDLAGKAARLAELLAKAQAGTKKSSDPLASVAELGRLYHANGFNEEATACWQLLCSEQPRVAQWYYYLADQERMASDYPAMAALLEKTTTLAPDYAPAWLLLAGLQFKTGHLEIAARDYEKRLTLVPGDPYARLWLARIALQNGRSDEARRLIEQLVKDAPEFSSAHNLYADMLASAGDTVGADRQRWLGRETGRFREAKDPWLNELWNWCYDFDQLCALGTLELQTGHADRAKSYYERAIQVRPGDTHGYELLGGLYLKQNDPAKARTTLEQSLPRLRNSKPSITYYLSLSQACRELKQTEEAVRVVRGGLRQVGDNLELYSTLGRALSDLGRPDEAIAAFHQALALNPNDAETNFNLGLSLLGLDRTDEAIIALKRSLTLQPTFQKSLSVLGRVELEGGHWESAGIYLRPLLESHPEMPEARQMMSSWHLHAGAAAEAKHDSAAAERHYHDGIALNPNNAELQVSLGVLCLVQGRFADALIPLEAYHRLQPGNAQGCLFLGQAYAANGHTDDARRVLNEGISLAEKTGNRVTANHCREMLQAL